MTKNTEMAQPEFSMEVLLDNIEDKHLKAFFQQTMTTMRKS